MDKKSAELIFSRLDEFAEEVARLHARIDKLESGANARIDQLTIAIGRLRDRVEP